MHPPRDHKTVSTFVKLIETCQVGRHDSAEELAEIELGALGARGDGDDARRVHLVLLVVRISAQEIVFVHVAGGQRESPWSC